MVNLNKIYSIEFDPSSGCTRRCWFCDPGIPPERRSNVVNMPLDIFTKQIDQIKALIPDYKHNIIFCGQGEPLLNPDLVHMVKYARESLPKCRVVVYTNGDILDEELLIQLYDNMDLMIYDNYCNIEGKRIKNIAVKVDKEKKILCVDHVNSSYRYYSRAGNIYKLNSSNMITAPCIKPLHNIFMAAEGYWLICCNDYKQAWKLAYDFNELIEAFDENIELKKLINESRSGFLPCHYCEMRPRSCNPSFKHCFILDCDFS